MNVNAPAVSVVIPVHNGAPWLAESIGSVLAQSHAPAEIIAIDDGSTDDSAALLHRFGRRVTVVCQAQGGIGAARNAGLERATGTHVAFLDQDDIWREDKLEKQVALLRQRPDVDVLHADATEFDERGTLHASYFALSPGLRRPDDAFRELIRFAIPLMSTVILKGDFLRRHGLRFPEDVSGVDDLGLLLEIAARGGQFAYQEERLTQRRLHPRNLSKDHYNRFARRVVLYTNLLQRLPNLRWAHRRALCAGLRQARFLTGEWFWGEGDHRTARAHLKAACGVDLLGIKAAAYLAASCLPEKTGRGLRGTRRLLRRAGII